MTRVSRIFVYYFALTADFPHRSIAQLLIASHFGCRTDEISLSTNANGKPVVADESNIRCHFNVSHTRSLSIVAISSEVEVGVDVEYVRPRRDYPGMARYAFLPEECDAMLGSGDLPSRFVAVWARKEAIIKAVGGSAAVMLDRFAVATDPSRGERVTRVPGAREPIRYRDLPVGRAHRATVAWRDHGPEVAVEYRRLTEKRIGDDQTRLRSYIR